MVTGADLPEDPDVRSYLISGTDHLGPTVEMKTAFPLGNPPHNLDPAPVVRALFVQLVQWVVDGTEPAPSVVPRQADGTAVTRAAVLESFLGAARPEVEAQCARAAHNPSRVKGLANLNESIGTS